MSWWSIAEQVAGTCIFLFVLLDIFMTVLYARLGSHGVARWGAGVIGNIVGRSVRNVLGYLPAPRKRRDAILSFCGPVTVVLLLSVWSWSLGIGAAMILQPHLGDSILVHGSDTPTDFVAALYAAGTSLAITGSSEFEPRTEPMRLLYLMNSLVGTTVVTLAVTYLLQLYTSLQRRDTLALDVNIYTSETGDAAELIAAMAPLGDFSLTINNLAGIAQTMTSVEEAHHFYPVLFYFRTAHESESLIRVLLVSLDTVSLIRSVLSDRECARVGGSAPIIQLWRASLMTADMLQSTFLGQPDPPPVPRVRGCEGEVARAVSRGPRTPGTRRAGGPGGYRAWRREIHRAARALAARDRGAHRPCRISLRTDGPRRVSIAATTGDAMSTPHPSRHRIAPHAGRVAGVLGLAAALYAAVAGAITLVRETRRFRDASGVLYRRWTPIPAIAGTGRLRIHARVRDVMTNAGPIVLVHGLGMGMGSSYFVPLAARLSKHAPVYAPDLPGHGASDHDARALGVPELAHALGTWMDAMGLRGATLVAHSLGCQVAAHAVAARPELAARLVLMGPTADPAARSGKAQLMRSLQTSTHERRSAAALMALDYARAGTDVLRTEIRGMLEDRMEDLLPRLSCPVFVVRGARDRIVSQRWAEEVARLARAPQPTVVPGWGHAVHYDDPETLAALIVRLTLRGERRTGPPRP